MSADQAGAKVVGALPPMLISWRHRFIFVHVYRTAGTSMTAALAPLRPWNERAWSLAGKLCRKTNGPDPPGWRLKTGILAPHASAREIKALLPPAVFDRCFKFGFVRNPWDLEVSLYKYMLRTTHHFQNEEIKRLGSFDAYVEWRVSQPPRLQSFFLTDEGGMLLVDFVGRFEEILDDFSHITQKLGHRTELPSLNTSSPPTDYRDWYSKRTRDLIYARHAQDIERFRYDF